MAQELKSNLQPNIYDTLMHCLETSTMHSQICFHRRLFANPVKLHSFITGLVGPLDSTNQSWCGVKLLTMFATTHPGDSINGGIAETVGFQFAMFIATLILYEYLCSKIIA